MNWMSNPYRHTANEAEDLSYPPTGGRIKLILLGIILPLGIVAYAVIAWITEEAVWFGQRNYNMIVHGQTAKALAATYLSVGLFCHFRWLWGLIQAYRVYEIGTTVSLLGFLGGLFYAVYTLFG